MAWFAFVAGSSKVREECAPAILPGCVPCMAMLIASSAPCDKSARCPDMYSAMSFKAPACFRLLIPG